MRKDYTFCIRVNEDQHLKVNRFKQLTKKDVSEIMRWLIDNWHYEESIKDEISQTKAKLSKLGEEDRRITEQEQEKILKKKKAEEAMREQEIQNTKNAKIHSKANDIFKHFYRRMIEEKVIDKNEREKRFNEIISKVSNKEVRKILQTYSKDKLERYHIFIDECITKSDKKKKEK